MKNTNPYRNFFLIILLCSLSLHSILVVAQPSSDNSTISFPIGVILDLQTWLGRMANDCISLAVSDFYSAHSYYRTRLNLHVRDSKEDEVDAVFAAKSLINDEHVEAIIGPQASTQAEFIADFGGKSQVPVVSFSATGLFLSSKTPYFVRMVPNDAYQVKAITAVVKAFGWKEVVPIYEDTNYGNGVIPHLIDSFQEFDAHITYRSAISPSATEFQIHEELNKLMRMQCRVFVVHMTSPIGIRFFQSVKNARMMSEGYVWIVTDGITHFLESVDHSVIHSMQGILGIRTHVPWSKELDNFRRKYKTIGDVSNPIVELSPYGIFAYDTLWALAMAAEKVVSEGWSSQGTKYTHHVSDLRISQVGPELLRAILGKKFHGLSGNISLVNGQLELNVFEIVNVIGKGMRVVGLWTPSQGILPTLDENGERMFSTPHGGLGAIIWPGGSITIPKGWTIPAFKKPLRIGVPVKEGFKEFVNVTWDPSTKTMDITGYGIDVFKLVIAALPYHVPYNLIPFQDENGASAGSYDDLVLQVYTQNYDAVVGDITITAKRSYFVDFSQPYTRGGVSMIVPYKHKSNNMLIFFAPMTRNLWITWISLFIITGIVISIMEAMKEIEQNSNGTSGEQGFNLFWAPILRALKFISTSFLALTLGQGEDQLAESSKFLVRLWGLLSKVMLPIYLSVLVAKITEKNHQPTISNARDLIENGDYVGYQEGTYVLELLKKLNFDESMIKGYKTAEEYDEALSKGSKNGGVSAIFEELTYIDVFFKTYCDKYTKAGQVFTMDGMGFVFPRGSNLAGDVSRALLTTMEGDEMEAIDKKWFGRPSNCPDKSNTDSPIQLSVKTFQVLFLTILIIIISLLCSGFNRTHPNESEEQQSNVEEPINEINNSSGTPPSTTAEEEYISTDENRSINRETNTPQAPQTTTGPKKWQGYSSAEQNTTTFIAESPESTAAERQECSIEEESNWGDQ
ncbi:glutamate receptor 2.7-like [Macadamia integrifolia]|uniref:glutamate receptor 2.7-like n=1 Tax=Macadamia integrifolia TaxID=60698 RepID=UPI001C5006BD|nr:glutamate receptor 2.7-like [Macadamia integrifolia]